ncbi:MAG: hypothetical protein HY258_01905 [Chloroflexi bacterium]|nr:hypothetical protein [Chloroflexota bacterium]
MKGIDLLVEICTRDDLMSTQKMWDEAVKDLNKHGENGSRELAKLLNEMLRCRADKISTVIVAAKKVTPVPELISVLESIETAAPVVPMIYGAKFRPEIQGGGQMGWTDGTAAHIKEKASEALKSLKAPA